MVKVMNLNLISNYKMIVKNTSYIFRSLEKDFDYQEYKKTVLGIKSCRSKLEYRMKSVYDGFIYLLDNKENELNDYVVSRFLFLIINEVDEDLKRIIINSYYEIENLSLIELIVKMYIVINGFEKYSKEERYIISLIICSYIYLKQKGNVIMYHINFLKEIRNKYEYKEVLNAFLELIINQKEIDYLYYSELKELTSVDIYKVINENKEIIKKEYKIKRISLFGSFSKGNERIDSDVDLLVSFKEGINYKEKKENAERFKEYMLGLIKRRVDVLEFNEFVMDSMIIEINKAIKII